MYVEIDAIILDQNNKRQNISIARDTVSYYRSFITTEDEGKDQPVTMVYLKGSAKALRVVSTYDNFKRQMNSFTIDVTGLNSEKLIELNSFIKELKNL
jgi:hypothetical protein